VSTPDQRNTHTHTPNQNLNYTGVHILPVIRFTHNDMLPIVFYHLNNP